MIGVILNHRYRIVELIGTGGMAQVYRAVNLTTRKDVAIKILKQEFRDNDEFLRRFEREARAVLNLSHDNIVRAYGVGQYDDMPYIILEYVEGRTLKDIIQERGAMPVKSAVNICNQVLDALSAAHAAGIIHRDVKPQNVIVTSSGKAKLTDFGIARDLQASTVTFTGSTVLGSAHYLSPEQAKGRPVTYESDLYSTGVMLYEMLTGDVPFTADTTVSIALKHINEEPLPPIELNPRISPALNEVVLRALRKAPEERFESAQVMKRALSHAQKNPDGGTTKSLPAVAEGTGVTPAGQLGFGGPRMHGSWKIAIVVGVFICIVVGAFLAIRSMLSEQTVVGGIVPSLTQKTVAEAVQRAENYDYSLTIGEYAVSASVPYGCVVSQSPEAGATARAGTAITVVVSLGPELPTMPSLLGKTYDEVMSQLDALGLPLGTVSYQVSEVAIGYVCAQWPVEGTEITDGQAVDIWISATSAESFVAMPSVTAYTLEEALDVLEESGFTRVLVRCDAAAVAPAGTICAQTPVMNESVQPGMAVTLTVAGASMHPYVSDVAYNVSIAESHSAVMVTIEETLGGFVYERILFENTFEKADKVPVVFTADAENGGMHELILYINGVEVRRQDTSFEYREP